MASLTETYADKIVGTLSCFDRIIFTGSLVDIAYAEAMAKTSWIRGVRLFDCTQFTEPLRDEVRANAERLAAENGLTVDYIPKKNFRKEERVKAILKERGDRPGLMHIFSAMESCPSFRPWCDKKTGQTFLKWREAKCLHYYFYFIDDTDREFDSARGGGVGPGAGGFGRGGRLASPAGPPSCPFPPVVRRFVPVSRSHPVIPGARGPSTGNIGAAYPLIPACSSRNRGCSARIQASRGSSP